MHFSFHSMRMRILYRASAYSYELEKVLYKSSKDSLKTAIRGIPIGDVYIFNMGRNKVPRLQLAY